MEYFYSMYMEFFLCRKNSHYYWDNRLFLRVVIPAIVCRLENNFEGRSFTMKNFTSVVEKYIREYSIVIKALLFIAFVVSGMLVIAGFFSLHGSWWLIVAVGMLVWLACDIVTDRATKRGEIELDDSNFVIKLIQALGGVNAFIFCALTGFGLFAAVGGIFGVIAGFIFVIMALIMMYYQAVPIPKWRKAKKCKDNLDAIVSYCQQIWAMIWTVVVGVLVLVA